MFGIERPAQRVNGYKKAHWSKADRSRTLFLVCWSYSSIDVISLFLFLFFILCCLLLAFKFKC